MTEVDLGGEKSFIGAWYLPDLSLCDDIVAFFTSNKNQTPGQIGNKGEVNPAIKDSIDVVVTPQQFSEPVITRYLATLHKVAETYCEKYQAAFVVDPWGVRENINIQHYRPGGGYKEWHTERRGKQLPSVNRHLVFMTYLNDVTDQGGTEFLYQRITAQPKKGLTLIWPADWTHMHRGIVSPTQDKYIITGWFSFV
jgi:hypothetical protein